MATFADAYTQIRARFEIMWPALHSDVRVLWPNERLDPLPDPTNDRAWIAFEVNSGPEQIASYGGLGNNLYKQSGDAVLHIFVPVGTGEELARDLGADASSIFRGWQDENLKFFSASTLSSSAKDNSGNWSNPVDCACSFDFYYVA